MYRAFITKQFFFNSNGRKCRYLFINDLHFGHDFIDYFFQQY
jgi:hypothetical protein